MKTSGNHRIHVAVTGLNSSQTPSPGIGVIHSLKADSREQISVIALAYDMFSDGIHSLSLADWIVELPFPQHQPEQFLKKISAFAAKVRIDCLIPTIDSEVGPISRMAEDLAKLGIRLLLPKEEALKAVSKERLAGWKSPKTFSLPPSAVIHSRSDLFHHAYNLGFPLMLKGPLGDAHPANSPLEAGVHFDALAKAWGTPIILQRTIHGEEYGVACLADPQHRAIGIVAMKKIIQDDGGTTWAGVTVQEPDLTQIARRLLQKLRWVGPLEMEFIREAVSGRYYLIEINNRFPAWIYLATRAGQNLPLACLKLALGEKHRPFPGYRSGILFVRVADDQVTDLDSLTHLMMRGEWNCHEKGKKGNLRKTDHHPKFSQGGQQICRP